MRTNLTTPAQLLVALDEAHADLTSVITVARNHPEREVRLQFSTPDGSQSHAFTAGASIASVLAHGHYHRAQCMNILRQLSVPIDSIDVIDWQQAEKSE